MVDEPSDPAFALFTEIGILHQLATALLEAQLPKGLIAPHFAVLNHLIRIGDGQTPLTIARALQVPKTSFTHTLSGLEKRRLVETLPHPSDGRSKQVRITAEGRRLRDETIKALAPTFSALQAKLPEGAIEAVLPQLRGLRQMLDEMRPPA